MKEKETMKGTKEEAAVQAEEKRRADVNPRDAAQDESEQRIDEIAERHRETLERLARD
jgi:hypothetical protein